MHILANVYVLGISAYNLLLMNLLFGMIYIMYFVRTLSNLTNYVFITIILSLIVGGIAYNHKKLTEYRKLYVGGSFVLGLLIFATAVTLFGIVKAFDHYTKILKMEAPRGDKGPEGEIGNQGITLDNDLNMCYNQAVEKVEQIMRKYKGTGNYDQKVLLFNNLYMKRQIKKICNSKKYDDLKREYGNHYTPVQLLNKDIEMAIEHLLKYNNGMRFLEDYFFTAYHWNNELLSKDPKKKELQSPFDYINTLDIWSWE
jgi:hypothetical protein